jgi:hypothetical protein
MRIEERGTRAGLVALALAALAIAPTAAFASGGGLEPAGSEGTTSAPAKTVTECSPEVGGLANGVCAPFKKARLIAGMAIAPPSALEPVRATIEAANQIRTKPYIWGGGHGRWNSPGYDCSGAVSFALHGGGFLETPLDSGEMMHWGLPGRGRWITIYTNPGHAFAVIDGLRWDTVGDAHGTGPRWHRQMVSTAGFVARHPPGY